LDFGFTPDPESPEKILLKILPSTARDSVNSVDVIDSGKILGFSTYNNILTQQKTTDMVDRESDFYNVTVNFVLRRTPQFEAAIQKKASMQADNGSALKDAASQLHEQQAEKNEDIQL